MRPRLPPPEAETYVRKISISCECQHEAPNAAADKKSDDEPGNWDRHSKHVCEDLSRHGLPTYLPKYHASRGFLHRLHLPRPRRGAIPGFSGGSGSGFGLGGSSFAKIALMGA
jgi:hypothetical protein